MAYSKKEAFKEDAIMLAAFAKALAHPARVAILKLLAGRQSCICGDIVEELPLSQSTVSQHLKELKAAGLIKGDVDGPRVCYCIDSQKWEIAQKALNELFNNFKYTDCNC